MTARLGGPEYLADDGGAGERNYDAWKREKIERSLTQSRERASMIPVEQLWRDPSLER